jgi:hypothetical protein
MYVCVCVCVCVCVLHRWSEGVCALLRVERVRLTDADRALSLSLVTQALHALVGATVVAFAGRYALQVE